jgi:hypothetical protein
MMKMKNISVFLIALCSTTIFAQETLNFCTESTTGWNKDDCIASCSQLRVDGVYGSGETLPDNSDGFCFGNATSLQYNIHKIAIGTSSGIMCNIFTGYLTLDLGRSTPGSTIRQSALNYSDCPAGTYDRVFVTTDRITKYTAETIFPDGSGKLAKTTSTFATDNLAGNVTDLSWMENMSGGTYASSGANSSKGYSRPGTSWNTAFKKVGSTPNASGITDVAAENNFDEWRTMYLNSLRRNGGNFDTSSVPNTDGDFYCETGDTGEDKNVCIKLDGNPSQVTWRFQNTSDDIIVGGLPLSLDKSKSIPLVQFSYHSAKRGIAAQEYGARFYFRRNGSNAVFLGTNVSENGLYITINQK